MTKFTLRTASSTATGCIKTMRELIRCLNPALIEQKYTYIKDVEIHGRDVSRMLGCNFLCVLENVARHSDMSITKLDKVVKQRRRHHA